MVTSISNCVHHWVIDASSGAISTGLCLKCHSYGAFRNAIDDVILSQHKLNRYNNSRKRVVEVIEVTGYDREA